jgi:transcriptional regulator with XRE-family HTH domain
MASVEDLKKLLREFQDSPEGYGHRLRMNLSELVLCHLKDKGWTQRQLAEKANKKESYITRVVHGQQNCGLDTVGEILFALGVRASIVGDSTGSGLERIDSARHTLDSTHVEEKKVYQDQERSSDHFRYGTAGDTGNRDLRFAAYAESHPARVG